MIDYSNIKTVEELHENFRDYFPTTEPIREEEIGYSPKDSVIKADTLKVIYSDTKAKPTCLFKTIIVFTNDRSENNKTLSNIEDALKNLSNPPKLYVFVAARVDADEEGRHIVLSDDKTTLELTDESNLDTLIFSRLGVQGELDAEKAVKILQDRGFLVLNPVRYSELASNKFDTAVLLEKAEIPQPNYCLMTKDILKDPELYAEALKEVYPEYSEKDPDKNKNLDVVVKILDGHGGTGVFMIDCKKLLAILQTIFAVDPERQLIIQRKEEADGGDIRVHVLTLRNKQVILGAMKRVKLGGDFRSNVSLGATAEPIKLTPEQEQIALKTARISHLPWCAVDIMPLVKGSNKELGDNVVLEINASPGTQGISEVLGVNFINIILNELDDPTEFLLQDKTAGHTETVSIDFGKTNKDFLAKLDTGNATSASTLEVGEFTESEDDMITFKVNGKELKFKKIHTLRAVAGEQVYERPVIEVPSLTLGVRKAVRVPIALVKNRDKKSTNILLNRDILSQLGYTVHPAQVHILTKESEKVKIL